MARPLKAAYFDQQVLIASPNFIFIPPNVGWLLDATASTPTHQPGSALGGDRAVGSERENTASCGNFGGTTILRDRSYTWQWPSGHPTTASVTG